MKKKMTGMNIDCNKQSEPNAFCNEIVTLHRGIKCTSELYNTVISTYQHTIAMIHVSEYANMFYWIAVEDRWFDIYELIDKYECEYGFISCILTFFGWIERTTSKRIYKDKMAASDVYKSFGKDYTIKWYCNMFGATWREALTATDMIANSQ